MNKKNKLKIGIDIDDVIINFIKPFLKFYNEKFKDNKNFSDCTSYHFSDCFKITKEKEFILIEEFNCKKFHELELIEEFKNKINFLFKNYEVFFITARPLSIKDNQYNALGCAKKGIKTFLINKPWNNNCENHNNLIKVDNWDEIMEKLKDESGNN